jgi:hypothetical protein
LLLVPSRQTVKLPLAVRPAVSCAVTVIVQPRKAAPVGGVPVNLRSAALKLIHAGRLKKSGCPGLLAGTAPQARRRT